MCHRDFMPFLGPGARDLGSLRQPPRSPASMPLSGSPGLASTLQQSLPLDSSFPLILAQVCTHKPLPCATQFWRRGELGVGSHGWMAAISHVGPAQGGLTPRHFQSGLQSFSSCISYLVPVMLGHLPASFTDGDGPSPPCPQAPCGGCEGPPSSSCECTVHSVPCLAPTPRWRGRAPHTGRLDRTGGTM